MTKGKNIRGWLGTAICLSLMLVLLSPATPAAAEGAHLDLSAASGVAGEFVTVSGTGFDSGVSGTIWFDTNGNGVMDGGETMPWGTITTDASGSIPGVALPVPPAVPTGTYTVQADFPVGGEIEASVTFEVTAGVLLSCSSGIPGVTTFITGSGFAADAAGTIWFDINGNGVLDGGEPSAAVTTDAGGAIPLTTSLVVPAATAGAYTVQADIPGGGAIEASATFTIAESGIIVSPACGNSRLYSSGITVTGTGFTPSTNYTVFFDRNRNGVRDLGEGYKNLTTDASGAISASGISWPAAPMGIYNMLFDLNRDGTIEASAGIVMIPSLYFATPYGVPGTNIGMNLDGFPANTAGYVWFDTNGNGIWDAGENQAPVTTNANGAATSPGLTVPYATPGVYQIGADIPSGGTVEAFGSYSIKGIVLGPDTGISGTSITVTGYGFLANRTGSVWFDIDGDSVLDAEEPSAAATSDGNGVLSVSSPIVVPGVAAGDYFVRADVPAGYTVEAAANFTVLGSPVAAFTADVTSGARPLTVHFTDLSTGEPASWAWDFDNDGTVDSTEQNPTHTYHAAGTYTVKLTVTNAYGSTEEVKADYITAVLPTYSITASASPGGSIDPAGEVVVEYGASQSFSIATDSGYQVADVLVDGASVGAVTSYQFLDVTANHTISVSFALSQPAWDLNGDHVCNIGDVVVIGLRWGETGEPGWIPEDVNKDGVVNIGDVVVIGLYWGETW